MLYAFYINRGIVQQSCFKRRPFNYFAIYFFKLSIVTILRHILIRDKHENTLKLFAADPLFEIRRPLVVWAQEQFLCIWRHHDCVEQLILIKVLFLIEQSSCFCFDSFVLRHSLVFVLFTYYVEPSNFSVSTVHLYYVLSKFWNHRHDYRWTKETGL